MDIKKSKDDKDFTKANPLETAVGAVVDDTTEKAKKRDSGSLGPPPPFPPPPPPRRISTGSGSEQEYVKIQPSTSLPPSKGKGQDTAGVERVPSERGGSGATKGKAEGEPKTVLQQVEDEVKRGRKEKPGSVKKAGKSRSGTPASRGGSKSKTKLKLRKPKDGAGKQKERRDPKRKIKTTRERPKNAEAPLITALGALGKTYEAPPALDAVVDQLAPSGGPGDISGKIVHPIDKYLYTYRYALVVSDFPSPSKSTSDLKEYKFEYGLDASINAKCEALFTIFSLMREVKKYGKVRSVDLKAANVDAITVHSLGTPEEKAERYSDHPTKGLTMDPTFLMDILSMGAQGIGDPTKGGMKYARSNMWNLLHDSQVKIEYNHIDDSGTIKKRTRNILTVVNDLLPGLMAYMQIMYAIDLEYRPDEYITPQEYENRDNVVKASKYLNVGTIADGNFALFTPTGREMMNWVLHKYESWKVPDDMPYQLLQIRPFFTTIVNGAVQGGGGVASLMLARTVNNDVITPGIYESVDAYKLSVVMAGVVTLLPVIIRKIRAKLNVETVDTYYYDDRARQTEMDERLKEELDSLLVLFTNFDNLSTTGVPKSIDADYLRMKSVGSVEVVGARALGEYTGDITYLKFAKEDLSNDGKRLLDVSVWVSALWKHGMMSGPTQLSGDGSKNPFRLGISELNTVFGSVRQSIISLSNGQYGPGNPVTGDAGLSMFLTIAQSRDPYDSLYSWRNGL